MKIFHPKVVQKIIGTLILILVYILVSKIPLPFVDISKSLSVGGATQGLQLTAAMMGGNLRSMSFISVGLSPWMSSMLLWRMFEIADKSLVKQKAMELQGRWQMYLTLIIALIQSLAISLNLTYRADIQGDIALLSTTVLLVTGAFFLIWLVDLNSIFGIGGSVTLIIIGILSNIPTDLASTMKELNLGWSFLLLLAVISLLLLYITVFVEKSKYRIPVHKTMIRNSFKDFSYIDIKINPSGGMPFMYAMTIVQIPVYVLLIAKVFMPRAKWIVPAIQELAMGKLLWFLIYAATIFILALAFAFINIDARKIAKQMQRSGEFIDHVYPGEDTRKYILSILSKFALLGAIYVMLFAVLPMSMALIDPLLLRISMIPGIFLMFFGMVFTVQDELRAITVNEQYKKIL